ncbi:hypothetical protein [uncultured Alistipes sp.]|uniref:hypothetical protein n=1 Tax=uncultured Alistipes sp. TaxID=538949 RepID=UPI00261FC7C5|nr:hypothetical protein [uncultured Alistipes sp.]
MGHKAIKQNYDIKHIVAIYNEEKYGGACICIGSGYVHGLIAINIATGKVCFSSLITPGENSEIGQLAARIKADEKNGVLRALIDEPDTFARNLPVFTIDRWAVKEELCEEYGWPNTTHSGAIMYENTYFRTRAEAYAYLLKETKAGVRYCRFSENFKEGLTRIGRAIRIGLREVWFWVAARTIGRFIIKRSYGKKRT